MSFRTNHEAGHVFSLTRKVESEFFRTHVYCDSSPCLADPASLSVVDLWTNRMLRSTRFPSSECTGTDFSAVKHQSTSQLQPTTQPTMSSIVGFLWTVKTLLSYLLSITKNVTTDVISNQPITCPSDLQVGHVTRQPTIASKNSSRASPPAVKSTNKTCV